ncbi:MAG: hypothetical protein WDM90_02255 [Ferruginibacter sp.]
MDNLFTQKIINANNVFDDRFLETKILYLYCFNELPSLHFINNIDGEKAFAVFKEKYGQLINHVHQYRWYKREAKKYQFDKTVVILKNNCLLEFDDDYCEILHDGKQESFIQELTNMMNLFKEKQRRQPLEINLIIRNGRGLDLKAMEVKRTKLDLNLFMKMILLKQMSSLKKG